MLVLAGTSACIELSRQQMVYDKQGVKIGIEHDPSTDRSSPPATNNHPARLKEDEIRRLLGSLQVSGYTGTIAGIFANARPIPLFKEEELRLVSGPLVSALGQAGPQERVFFSIPNLEVRYSDERTAGALFLRGPYLHVMLRDHSAFPRTDTAGGEDDKDPRDTKGLRLSVVAPARAAVLAQHEMPRWGPLEKIIIAINVREVLTASAQPPAPKPTALAVGPTPEPRPAAPVQPIATAKPESQTVTETTGDLRLQIRELTSSNLELRTRLQEQAQQMKILQDELNRLKQDLKKAAPKKRQTQPKAPPPPQ
jgi:hypothetical protein